MTGIDISRRHFIKISAAGAAVAAFSALGLAGCVGNSASSSSAGEADASAPNPIIIACLAREEPDVLFIAEQLKDKYTIQSQVFSDNNAINEATLDGSVSLNYFQNVPYLDAWNESKGSDLQFYQSGVIYTRDIVVAHTAKSIDEIPEGAKGLVANDAANQARELQLLEDAGLIKLNDSETPTLYDIVENPKNVEIIEVDPRSRVGAFPDVEFMVAPSITVYQMEDPDVTVSSALASESKDVFATTGGTGLVVTNEIAQENPQWLQDLYAAFQSAPFGDFVVDTYDGAKIPNVYLEKYE